MVEYRIVWYCGLCKERFVRDKRERKQTYCDACQDRINKNP